jgi:hypothetical protein
MEHLGNLVKEHLILGTDNQDAEKQRDLWLSQNPALKVLRMHPAKLEPPTWLTRIGSKHVPRVSITVEYEELDVRAEALSRPTLPSEENHRDKYRDAGGQSRVANILAGEAGLNVK